MFGIPKLIAACGKLASHANALAATLAEINDGLRSTLHLDGKPTRKVLAGPEDGNGKAKRKEVAPS